MMAERRRVQLTTLLGDVRPALTPQPQPGAGKAAAITATTRLQLTLFEPDERNFPEFNYSQLVDSKVGTHEADLTEQSHLFSLSRLSHDCNFPWFVNK